MGKLGHIFFIMGVSGSGKGTLRKNIYKQNRADIKVVPSCTTRLMRPGEIDGVSYFFISKDDFMKSVEKNDFLEYALVHKIQYYGTRKSDLIENGINKGLVVLKEIEVQGLEIIQKNWPDLRKNYSSIFLNVDDDTMTKRITGRAPISDVELNNRLESAQMERVKAGQICDYFIDTNKPPKIVMEEVLKIIDNKK